MAIANFTVATSDRVKGSDGQYTEKTEWHSCVAFQRTAEVVRDYVKKGNKLYVEGQTPEPHPGDDKATGQKKFRTEIIVSDISPAFWQGRLAPQFNAAIGILPRVCDHRAGTKTTTQFRSRGGK